ncbi:MAG: DNRLRE domain-containing protein [Dysgonomonas sp.]
MRKFTFILIILLGCSMSNISAQEVIKDMQGTLSGDTYVNGTGGLDNTAMGEHATMKNRIYVKYNNKREGYIKFNISDIAAEVVDKIYVGKAELSVFLYAALTDEAILHSLMAKQSASTWDESTLTYNNRPLPEDAVLCEITLSESQKAANSEVKFDVTQAVKKSCRE